MGLRDVFAWAIFVFAAMQAAPAFAQAARDLDVKVGLNAEAEGYFLDIQLRNKGSQALSIADGDLPWRGWNGMVLALMTPVGKELGRSGEILDPFGEPVELKPGAVLGGRIRLDKRFPSLREELSHDDVIVFWSYQLRLDVSTYLERVGGWLLIPSTNPSITSGRVRKKKS